MIAELDPTKKQIAQQIHELFQRSYAVEAALLKAKDFPPLKRSVEHLIQSKTAFFGLYENNILLSVVEMTQHDEHTRINSLVVDPTHFRQGIASRMMVFVLDRSPSKRVVVETGLANGPAIDLYKKFGFREVRQYDTEFGIRKIRLALER